MDIETAELLGGMFGGVVGATLGILLANWLWKTLHEKPQPRKGWDEKEWWG